MLIAGALDNWLRQAHGPRTQANAISFIANKLATYNAFIEVLGNDVPTLTDILTNCSVLFTPDVTMRTLR